MLSTGLRTATIDADKGGGVVVFEDTSWTPPKIDNATREQAAVAFVNIEAHLAPAAPDRLGFEISKLLAHRWRNKPEDADPMVRQALMVDWLDDTATYPLWAIQAAAREWRRTQAWCPTIADLRRLCEEAVQEDRQTLRLLAKLLRASASE